MRVRVAAVCAAVTVLLAACGAGLQDSPAPTGVEVNVDPVVLGTPAPPSDLPGDSVPMALADQPVLDPGWDQEPRELDGLLLGIAYPAAGEDGPIRFIAAREDGTLLWQAQRPPSCTGFTLSRAATGPVAVLTDVVPGVNTLGETQASGYDLATGEQLWGPVPVPGPHQGPGAVFAAPAPGAAMGETGPRVALDVATGEVVATEDDGAVVGEYDGVVLTASDATLHASGAQEWSVPLAALGLTGDLRALPAAPPLGTALVAGDGDRTGVLLDLRDGQVLARDIVDAAREPMSDTIVTAGPTVVSGYPPGGEEWQRPLADARIAGAGNVFAYVRTGEQLRAVNVVSGQDAVAFEDGATRPAVPVVVTERGAAVVDTGVELALVPSSA